MSIDYEQATKTLMDVVELAFYKQSATVQFHDLVLNSMPKRSYRAKHAAQKKDKDPKAMDHKSPLTDGKRTTAKPSDLKQEKAAAAGVAVGGSGSMAAGGASPPLNTQVTTSLPGSVAKPQKKPDKSLAAFEAKTGAHGSYGKPKGNPKGNHEYNKKNRGKTMTKAYSIGYAVGGGSRL